MLVAGFLFEGFFSLCLVSFRPWGLHYVLTGLAEVYGLVWPVVFREPWPGLERSALGGYAPPGGPGRLEKLALVSGYSRDFPEPL